MVHYLSNVPVHLATVKLLVFEAGAGHGVGADSAPHAGRTRLPKE
jgi:hypothetical protein